MPAGRTDLTDPTPTGVPDPIEAHTAADILASLRALAAEADPDRRRLYEAMPPARWADAASLTADLLIGHWRYLADPQRGRRAHNATIYGILEGTNQTQVLAGIAWVMMAFRLLPDRPPKTADAPKHP